MRISEQEKNKIVASFQRIFKHDQKAENEVRSYSLEQLRQVDEMLGNRDLESGFRIAIRNQIKRLEEKGQRLFESRIRGIYIIIGVASATLSGLIVYFLTSI